MGYGFALVPDPATVDTLIAFQTAVNERITLSPRLGVSVNRPHITLYQGNLSRLTPIHETLSLLRSFLGDIPPIFLDLRQIIYKPQGWYFLLANESTSIHKLQALLLKSIGNHILLGTNSPDDAADYAEDELDGFQKCGYRYIGRAFLPHITLGRNRSLDPTSTLSYLNSAWNEQNVSNGKIGSITFYKMGAEGAHFETVYETALVVDLAD